MQTFVDAAIFDVKSRKLLFRAPGINHIESKSTLVGSAEETRKTRERSFAGAMANMTVNLDNEVNLFRERIKTDRSVTVTQRAGSSGASRGGGGALGGATLMVLLGMLALAWARQRLGRLPRGVPA